MTESEEPMRQAFEQWAISDKPSVATKLKVTIDEAGDYDSSYTMVAWEAWHARDEAHAAEIAALKKEKNMHPAETSTNGQLLPTIEVQGETIIERHLREELRIANAHLLTARREVAERDSEEKS